MGFSGIFRMKGIHEINSTCVQNGICERNMISEFFERNRNWNSGIVRRNGFCRIAYWKVVIDRKWHFV
jgi:hypothetical protein